MLEQRDGGAFQGRQEAQTPSATPGVFRWLRFPAMVLSWIVVGAMAAGGAYLAFLFVTNFSFPGSVVVLLLLIGLATIRFRTVQTRRWDEVDRGLERIAKSSAQLDAPDALRRGRRGTTWDIGALISVVVGLIGALIGVAFLGWLARAYVLTMAGMAQALLTWVRAGANWGEVLTATGLIRIAIWGVPMSVATGVVVAAFTLGGRWLIQLRTGRAH